MSENIIDIKVIAKDSASKVFDGVRSSAKKLGGAIGSGLKTAFNIAAAAGTAVIAGTAALGGAALKAAADVQTMRVALNTTFQGNIELAKEAEKAIRDFATRTPFQVAEVMDAFIKLKNMGLDPGEEALKSYGDTASALGKPLNQMIEAVADAAVGEFERLKEFGIRSSAEGDRVKFTFQGITTEVGKNAEEIEDYLINLGQTNFAGGMEAQSETLTGRISTLKDTFSNALATIAEDSGLLDVASEAVLKLTEGVDDIAPIIDRAITFFQAFAADVASVMQWIASLPETKAFIEELKELSRIVRDELIEFWDQYGDNIKDFAKTAIPLVLKALTLLLQILGKIISYTKEAIDLVVRLARELKKFSETSAGQAAGNTILNSIPGARIAQGIGNLIPGFASGGEFTVGGRGGRDNNLVQFMASRGERVIIEKEGESNKNININNYFSGGITAETVASRIAFELNQA